MGVIAEKGKQTTHYGRRLMALSWAVTPTPHAKASNRSMFGSRPGGDSMPSLCVTKRAGAGRSKATYNLAMCYQDPVSS